MTISHMTHPKSGYFLCPEKSMCRSRLHTFLLPRAEEESVTPVTSLLRYTWTRDLAARSNLPPPPGTVESRNAGV